MKWYKLISLAIGVYVLTLLATLPASRVYAWINLPPQTAFYELSGTPWSGKANYAIISGARIENISWRLHVLPFVLGRLQYGHSIPFGKHTLSVSLAKGWNGNGYINDLNGNISMKTLLKQINSPYQEAEGQLQFADVSLQLSAEGLESAQGEIKWTDAKVTLPMAELGSFSAKLNAEKNMLKATINSVGKSAVNLQANIALRSSGEFNLSGKLDVKKGSMLDQLLANLGRRRGKDGKYLLKEKNRLPFQLKL